MAQRCPHGIQLIEIKGGDKLGVFDAELNGIIIDFSTSLFGVVRDCCNHIQ